MSYGICKPDIKSYPFVELISPVRILKIVVFPAPDIPNNDKDYPFLIDKDKLSIATLSYMFEL